MTQEEILKKLQIARDAWGPSYSAKGYSPYASPTAGQEGYREILKEKLRFLNAGYGKDAKYSYGDPMKHFNDPEQIETLLGYDIVDKPIPPLVSGPSHFDLMRKDGVPVLSQEEIYAQQPPGGVGGGYKAGLSPWQGYSLGASSYNINDPMIAGLMEGPETANMQLSPYELTLLAEDQQRHAPAPPQFPGFQNVIDPDQLAGIRGITGSPDYLAGPQGTFTGDSYEGEWSPTQMPPNVQGQWGSTPQVKDPYSRGTSQKPAGLLDTGSDKTTIQTGYNKSKDFNNALAMMLLRLGAESRKRREW